MSIHSQLFASSLFDGDNLAPVLVAFGFIAIPIVGILTRHQRKMAEILHGRAGQEELRAELDSMRRELSDLRTQLRALNSRSSVSSASDDELSRRLG